MTEDDTFMALKKLPYDQLNRLFFNTDYMQRDERDAWLKSYGWTREEFRAELHRKLRDD